MEIGLSFLILFGIGLFNLWIGGQLNELMAMKKIPQRKVKDIKWLYIPHDGMYRRTKLPSEEKYDGKIYLVPFIFAIITYILTLILMIIIVLIVLFVDKAIAYYISLGYFLYSLVIIAFEGFYAIKYRKDVVKHNDYMVVDKNDKEEKL